MDEAREPLPSRVEGLPELPDEALTVLETGLDVLGLDGLDGTSRLGAHRSPAAPRRVDRRHQSDRDP